MAKDRAFGEQGEHHAKNFTWWWRVEGIHPSYARRHFPKHNERDKRDDSPHGDIFQIAAHFFTSISAAAMASDMSRQSRSRSGAKLACLRLAKISRGRGIATS